MSAGSKSASNFGRLALVVDLNAASWATFFEEGKSSQGSHLTLSSFLDQLLALAHQYSMLDRNNRVSLMTFNTECNLCYPVPRQGQDASSTREAVPKFDYTEFKDALEGAVHASSITSTSSNKPVSLAIALTRMILHLHRQERDLGADREDEADLEMPTFLGSENFPARIVLFSATPDVSADTMHCLNAIFAAHKQNITIDCIFLSSSRSSQTLQIAADLTSGYYFNVHNTDDLAKVILSRLLVDASLREELKLPHLTTVSNKATCFCHKRLISIGYVCSVCLSVFCEPSSICQVCGVTFAEESLPTPLALAINLTP